MLLVFSKSVTEKFYIPPAEKEKAGRYVLGYPRTMGKLRETARAPKRSRITVKIRPDERYSARHTTTGIAKRTIGGKQSIMGKGQVGQDQGENVI